MPSVSGDQMTLAGYDHVTQVVRPGEYSVRGGLIDLYPMGSTLPYRIDLFDDEIESIKTFDPDTQRTVYPVGDPPAAGARVPDRRCRRTRFSQALPRDLRGRSVARIDLQGRLERHRSGRHRVLPAAVLRRDRNPLRLSARGWRGGPSPATCPARWRISGAMPAARHRLLGGDRTGRCSRRANCFSPTKPSSSRSKAARACKSVADRAARQARPPRLPQVAVGERPTIRCNSSSWTCSRASKTLGAGPGIGRPARDHGRVFAEYGLKPAATADFASFVDSGERLAAAASDRSQAASCPRPVVAIITETELYASTARPAAVTPVASAATAEGWLRDLSELKRATRWCIPARHRPLPRPGPHGPGRRRHRVSAPRIRRRRQALRARSPSFI